MSILIKGMEMPKNCHSCPMCIMRFCQAADRELSERETRPNAKRPDDCPLVPAQPHVDLIDRDALGMNYLHIRDDGMKIYTQRAIDNAPTIIPAEEGER